MLGVSVAALAPFVFGGFLESFFVGDAIIRRRETEVHVTGPYLVRGIKHYCVVERSLADNSTPQFTQDTPVPQRASLVHCVLLLLTVAIRCQQVSGR